MGWAEDLQRHLKSVEQQNQERRAGTKARPQNTNSIGNDELAAFVKARQAEAQAKRMQEVGTRDASIQDFVQTTGTAAGVGGAVYGAGKLGQLVNPATPGSTSLIGHAGRAVGSITGGIMRGVKWLGATNPYAIAGAATLTPRVADAGTLYDEAGDLKPNVGKQYPPEIEAALRAATPEQRGEFAASMVGVPSTAETPRVKRPTVTEPPATEPATEPATTDPYDSPEMRAWVDKQPRRTNSYTGPEMQAWIQQPGTGKSTLPPGITYEGAGVGGRSSTGFSEDQVAAANQNIRKMELGLPSNRGFLGEVGGAPRGMSEEQYQAARASGNMDAVSKARVAQMQEDMAAYDRIRNARITAMDGRPPVGPGEEKRVFVMPDTGGAERDLRNARMRIRNEGEELSQGLNRRGHAAVAQNTAARLAALDLPQGEEGGEGANLSDAISLANLERGLRSDQQKQQQDMFGNQLALTRESRQQQTAAQKAARQQQQDFMAGATPFMQQASDMFQWLPDSSAYFQGASGIGATQGQALNTLAGAYQEIGKMDDPSEPLFTLNGHAVTGADAVAILNGEKPFSKWGQGPGKEFYETARQRAAQAIQDAALRELQGNAP